MSDIIARAEAALEGVTGRPWAWDTDGALMGRQGEDWVLSYDVIAEEIDGDPSDMRFIACHHRTAPRMDDEPAALATAAVWAELFTAYRLALPDLMAAVKKRAMSHTEAPEPAEIIAFAREIRRDRAERESTADREAREDRHDAALDNRNRLAGIVTGFVTGKELR
jgi:hypothetical protein